MNKLELLRLKKIFRPKDRDWLGFKITHNNPLTYHHLFKQIYGNWEELDIKYQLHNGSLLTKNAHKYIHLLESIDHDKFVALTELMRQLNQSMTPPDEEYYEKVKKIRNR